MFHELLRQTQNDGFDEPAIPQNTRRRLRAFAFASSGMVMAIGCLALLGWALDLEVLKRVLSGYVSMKVNTALGQIDQLTQQTAAMSEESTAACRSVANESNRLMKLIGRFRLRQHAASPVSAPLVRKAS